MAKFEVTVFKLGERAVVGLGRVAVPRGAGGVAQQWVSANDFAFARRRAASWWRNMISPHWVVILEC
jgi:hypothetical protein